MDIENDYFEKDRLIEDTTEEFIIELGEDDSDDDDMMDKDDRQIIDEALQKIPEPTQTCIDLRHN